MIELSARIGDLILHAAAARGASPAAVAAEAGFDPSIATDADARISLTTESALWQVAARHAGDPDLGLHAAELIRPGAFDVLDYAVRTAPTLRAAVERLARYNRLVHDAAEFTLHEEGDHVSVEHAFRIPGKQDRHSAEFTMAALVVLARQLVGDVQPVAIDFTHPSPPRVTEHVRILGVSPSFDAPVKRLVLLRSELERPVAGADPALSGVMQRHADALLSALPDVLESTAGRLSRILGPALAEGEASLPRAAAALRVSARTLQRRLAAEGFTFDQVVDDLRRTLAARYLADRSIAIGEVAYLLGFSEPSAFHRAYRRWTGRTPAQVRRNG